MHKCPECGCTKYIESGQLQGRYEMTLSDDPIELKEIEKALTNEFMHDSLSYHANKLVKCVECGKKYKPKEAHPHGDFN